MASANRRGDKAEVEGFIRRFDTDGIDGRGNGTLSDTEQTRLRNAFEAPVRIGSAAVTDALVARIFAKASPDGSGTIDVDRVQDAGLRNFLYRADNIDGATSPRADRRVDFSDIKRTIDLYAHNGPRLDRNEVRTLLAENPGLVV